MSFLNFLYKKVHFLVIKVISRLITKSVIIVIAVACSYAFKLNKIDFQAFI